MIRNNSLKSYLAIFLMISFPLSGQLVLPSGYPVPEKSTDVLTGFRNPPKGYGEVPFY